MRRCSRLTKHLFDTVGGRRWRDFQKAKSKVFIGLAVNAFEASRFFKRNFPRGSREVGVMKPRP